MIFAVNKNLQEDLELTVPLRQFEDYVITEHVQLHHEDLYAVNTEEAPNTVIPAANGCSRVEEGILTATLSAKSWNMIRLGK